MPSDDIAISVRNLTKTYRLFGHPGDRVKQFLSLGFKRYHREFTALKNVSFDIKKGETVGILGKNGSGKSTLLQLICGILKPTAGTVEVRGRVSALLELGAGFNPEFTGRENVYFQGALMGFTRAQMDERFDAIAAFADIGEFIDQPVRTYSSGMFVRLAFAVAIHVEPDILVVDEALGVGDLAFQSKCLRRIDELRNRGGTILLVSHSPEQIAHRCQRAGLLDRGHLMTFGDTTATLEAYLDSLLLPGRHCATDTARAAIDARDRLKDKVAEHPAYSPEERRWGDGRATIVKVDVRQGNVLNPPQIFLGQRIEILIDIHILSALKRTIVGLTVKTAQGAVVLTTNSRELLGIMPDFDADTLVRATFRLTPLFEPGRHLLSLGLVSEAEEGLVPHDRRYDVFSLDFVMPDAESGKIAMVPAFSLEKLA